MATGCAFFDYDNDGWMDIFILGGRTLAGTPPGSGNRLYHNNRNGTFTDVTAKSGLSDPGWAQGVCVGDYNNDGWEDLFLTYYGQNRLYRNNGDGTFTNVTAEAGLLYPKTRYSTGCTFVDYNRDGHLDLFVSNYLEIDLATAPKPSLDVPNCNYEGVATMCGPLGLPKAQHYLYRNNGDGTFTDVSRESGIAALRGSYGLTAVSIDADEDGWPDIFVACDMTPSLLLMNNHDGTFREEALDPRHRSQWRRPGDGRHGRGRGRLQPRRPYRHRQDALLQPGHRPLPQRRQRQLRRCHSGGRPQQGNPLCLLWRRHRGLRQRRLSRHSAHVRHGLSRGGPRFAALSGAQPAHSVSQSGRRHFC